jgi:predicted ATPase
MEMEYPLIELTETEVVVDYFGKKKTYERKPYEGQPYGIFFQGIEEREITADEQEIEEFLKERKKRKEAFQMIEDKKK